MPSGARAIRREHVESYFAERREAVKPTTLSVKFRALQQFWKWALDEEEIDRLPMERMRPPRVPDSPVPVVSIEDFRRLLKAAAGRDLGDRRDTAILLLLFDTGLRRGELIGLQVDDLDLRERVAYVTGKGGHRRVVRFGGRTAVALDRYQRLRRAHSRADSAALWLGQVGPLTASALAQLIAQALQGGRPGAAPPAPVPPHLRPRMACQRGPGGRPDAPSRMAVGADASSVRSKPCQRTGASHLPQSRGSALIADARSAGHLTPCGRSFALLLTKREDRSGHLTGVHRSPFDVEAPAVTEEPAPSAVPDVDDDPESVGLLVIPLTNVGDAAEGHREVEGDRSLVEPLGARSKA